MNRFHIVVPNYQRLQSFVENFHKISGINTRLDAIFIFDCTPENVWEEQLAIADRLRTYDLEWNRNLFFIRRRNWGVNHGAQLDYFRAILDGLIQTPRFVAFMQEHFLDLKNYVKEDTIPEHSRYDLSAIAKKFESDPQIGCAFHARNGVRVSTSNPVTDSAKEFFGDGEVLLEGATRRGFLIDGGNFIVRPELYLRWFSAHLRFLTDGDGGYGFSHVWEARLGQILYDQKIKWCDLSRNLEYTTIAELDELQKSLSQKISKLWYDNRVWYFYYGKDQWKYPPLPLKSMLRYYFTFMAQNKSFPRDTSLEFCQPRDS